MKKIKHIMFLILLISYQTMKADSYALSATCSLGELSITRHNLTAGTSAVVNSGHSCVGLNTPHAVDSINGIFYIEVPDQRHVSLLGLLGKKYGLNYHVSFFCRKSLTRLMSLTGINPIFSKYDFNSSYRGNGIESIIAVGRFNKQNQLTNNTEPNFLYEFFTTVFLFIRLAFKKFVKI